MEKYRVVVKGVVKAEGKYLLVKRWYTDRIESPFQWEFVDGRIEFGEAPEAAVIRNVKDSAGIDVTPKHVLYTWSYVTGNTHHIGISYLCEASDTQIILSEDLSEYAWVAAEDLDAYIQNRILLADIKKALLQE